MTGQRKWFDWAERSVRHHFDVDICHWQPAKDAIGVVGGVHGYWGDHSDTPCYSLIQNSDGAFDHWNLTGDPCGYRYGVGIAEYVRSSPNIASAQAYGAYVTQDAGLAEIARRTWLGGLQGGTVYPEMAYDLAGVVWWLDQVAAFRAK